MRFRELNELTPDELYEALDNARAQVGRARAFGGPDLAHAKAYARQRCGAIRSELRRRGLPAARPGEMSKQRQASQMPTPQRKEV